MKCQSPSPRQREGWGAPAAKAIYTCKGSKRLEEVVKREKEQRSRKKTKQDEDVTFSNVEGVEGGPTLARNLRQGGKTEA